MKKLYRLWLLAGIVAGCGGGGDSGSSGPVGGAAPGPSATLTGQLVDSSVVNVAYSTSSGLRGMTGLNGDFSYRAGDTVKFSIGKIVLGEGRGAAIVTPIDLVAGAVALDHPDVVKILQVLQTLDDDGDPANGILIPAAVTQRLGALPSEKHLKDVGDLVEGVIALAFSGAAPVLKTPAAATLHFADTLGFLEATQQMARMPAVSNFVVGGGNKNCSSFNGDLKSTNCAGRLDDDRGAGPAFTGLTKDNISFASSYPFPTFTYSISQDGIDRFNALPASLFDSSRKAAALAALTARFAGTAPKTGLSFPDFDGSKTLFADGAAFWNGSSLNDFNLLLTVMCGAASPENGADCALSDANIAAIQAATFETAADRDKVC